MRSSRDWGSMTLTPVMELAWHQTGEASRDITLFMTRNNAHPLRTVFHSTLEMGRHGSGLPSLPIFAAKRRRDSEMRAMQAGHARKPSRGQHDPDILHLVSCLCVH